MSSLYRCIDQHMPYTASGIFPSKSIASTQTRWPPRRLYRNLLHHADGLHPDSQSLEADSKSSHPNHHVFDALEVPITTSRPTFQNIHTLQAEATKAMSKGREATNLSGAFMFIYIYYRLKMWCLKPKVFQESSLSSRSRRWQVENSDDGDYEDVIGSLAIKLNR